MFPISHHGDVKYISMLLHLTSFTSYHFYGSRKKSPWNKAPQTLNLTLTLPLTPHWGLFSGGFLTPIFTAYPRLISYVV